MVKEIYDLMHKLSKEHKLISSFKYDMLSKSAGTGEDNLPMVFLEMPIYIGNVDVLQGSVPVSFSFDVVLNPQALENYDVKQLNSVSCQEIARQIAQQIIVRMRNLYKDDESVINPQSYSMLTLQRWYDDSSYGVRVTVSATVMNDILLCADDDYFDEGKEFTKEELIKDIDTDDASGCESLSYKLPKIDL